MSPSRCEDERFVIEPAARHTEILLACLRLMEQRLKRNICNLDDYAALSEVKTHIGDGLEYACKFWTKHLLETPTSGPRADEVQGVIEKFFKVHLLHWVEVLAITRNLSVGVHAMNDIHQWYNLVSRVKFIC